MLSFATDSVIRLRPLAARDSVASRGNRAARAAVHAPGQLAHRLDQADNQHHQHIASTLPECWHEPHMRLPRTGDPVVDAPDVAGQPAHDRA